MGIYMLVVIQQRIFTSPTLSSIDQFCRTAGSVCLKKHYGGQIEAVVLSVKDAYIP
jgi:hypothetical protein